MSDYLTCEADLNFPGPTLDEVVAEVRSQYRGRVPVTAAAVARALNADKVMVRALLERAAHARMVLRTYHGGWLPLVNEPKP